MPVLQQTLGLPVPAASLTASGGVLCTPYVSPPQPQISIQLYNDENCLVSSSGTALVGLGQPFDIPTTGTKRVALDFEVGLCGAGLDPMILLSDSNDCAEVVPLTIVSGKAEECNGLSSGADVKRAEVQCRQSNGERKLAARSVDVAASTLSTVQAAATSPSISASGAPGVNGTLTSEKFQNDHSDDVDSNNDDCCNLGCEIM